MNEMYVEKKSGLRAGGSIGIGIFCSGNAKEGVAIDLVESLNGNSMSVESCATSVL